MSVVHWLKYKTLANTLKFNRINIKNIFNALFNRINLFLPFLNILEIFAIHLEKEVRSQTEKYSEILRNCQKSDV